MVTRLLPRAFLFAVGEQHLFRILGSLENIVSEPVHFFSTPLDTSLPEISRLVPGGGAVIDISGALK